MRRLRPGDRWTLAAGLCLAGGAVLLLVAWYDISGTNQLYEQVPYLVSAGFAGLALVMVGSALLVAGRYDRVERRLARLIDAVTEPAPEPPPPVADPPDAGRDTTERVVVAGGTTFHRPTCPLVHGKSAPPVDPATIRARELTACPVCDPTDPSAPAAP